METRVQYAKTSDGVDIAFAVYGEGPALVIPPSLTASHLQQELVLPVSRSFHERLSQRLQLIRYDCRGLGMSQREPIDFSPDAAERDMLAVVDRLGLERFALYSHVLAGEGPMAFAANRPDRVTGLFWWLGQTVLDSADGLRQYRALDPLMDTEWDLYTEIAARLVLGWSSPDASGFASLMRAGISPAGLRAAGAALRQLRAFDWATRVQVPTLVAHLAAVDGPTGNARTLASRIQTSHVVAIPGPPGLFMPFVYDSEVLVKAIADFVEGLSTENGGGAARSDAVLATRSGTAVILFADIVESTALTERMGDAAFRARARDLDASLRSIITEAGGTTIDAKTLGDGVLATFPAASQAIDAALRCGAAGDAQGLPLHLGLHAGDVIREQNNVFGGAVNIASRISALSAPGEVLVSRTVADLARTSAGVTFEDRGEHALKGIAEPQRVYAVRKDGA
jgi:class 3 adenylate cyclase/pimeloyl-ACP methyl ester carboxylesterase